MEALTSLEGVKIKGEGSHQILIDYICKKHNLSEAQRKFLQEIREYRNRISYEGFYVKNSYIKENETKIERIIKLLVKLVDDNLQSNYPNSNQQIL